MMSRCIFNGGVLGMRDRVVVHRAPESCSDIGDWTTIEHRPTLGNFLILQSLSMKNAIHDEFEDLIWILTGQR